MSQQQQQQQQQHYPAINTEEEAEEELKLKMTKAVNNLYCSTYGSDFLSPSETLLKAAELKEAYGGGGGGGGVVGRSTKQSEFVDFKDRPLELAGGGTRYSGRTRLVPVFSGGVLPPPAVSSAHLNAHAAGSQSGASTYTSEISRPANRREAASQSRQRPQQQQQQQQQLLVRLRSQWEGPL